MSRVTTEHLQDDERGGAACGWAAPDTGLDRRRGVRQSRAG